MNKMLSVYFSSERTYLAVTESTAKGLSLVYLNATETPVDLEVADDKNLEIAAQEMNALVHELGDDIERLSITLPSDNVLVTQFPYKPNMAAEDVKKLVEIEIKHAYPQFNYNDFISSVIHFAPRLDGKQMAMAEIIPKQSFISCRQLLQKVNLPISNIETSQLNAHTAFLYNYPEQAATVTAIIGVSKNFVDISVIKDKTPLYYSLAALKDPKDIGKVVEAELDKILTDYVTFVDCAYLYGEGLTKEMVDIVTSTLLGLVMEVGRLNAFRMFSSNLDARHREYCTRTAQIFPPCIGGCLPAYHQKVKLY
jgi:hypothetical protein